MAPVMLMNFKILISDLTKTVTEAIRVSKWISQIPSEGGTERKGNYWCVGANFVIFDSYLI